MRNLKLLETKQVRDEETLGQCQKLAIDQDTGTLYVASSKYVYGIDTSTGETCSTVCLTDDDFLPADGSGRVVGAHYLQDQQGVCLAASNGNLLVWSVCTGQLECVGSVESGFTAMAWSPDAELLVLATGDETLIMMTREFDPITEVSQHPQDTGEAAFVTVGWGKKETQFHGSEGKAAAQTKSEVGGGTAEWDDRYPRISWRGDGQYFGVSNISPNTGRRQLHTWTRECSHHSSSEAVEGLEQALAWKPSGSLIASTQSRPNKHDVIFFEKNGLRHGEFTLLFPVNTVKVREVMWNTESTVLAVWCETLNGNNTPPASHVQLWTVNNYHWYLKQSLEFEPQQHAVDVQWDLEHGYKLHVLCNGGQYLQYTWSWATCHSNGMTADDLASVAVIDGSKVLVTPMRKMVVPPPMSAYQLELPAPVSHVTFGPVERCNDILVLLANNDLAVYRLTETGVEGTGTKLAASGGPGFSVQCSTHTLEAIDKGLQHCEKETTNDLSTFPLSASHMTWLTPSSVLTSHLSAHGPHSVLCQWDLQGDQVLLRCSVAAEGVVHCIAVGLDSPVVAVQLNNGAVLRYHPDTECLLPWETDGGGELQLPYPCSQMSVCLVGGQEVVLGLTDRFRFYVNDVEIASNCTSYSVHDEYLLLTTLSHTCRCIARHTKLRDLPSLADGKEHPFDESIRRVERGSRIVTVVREDTKLVLQMPRGNLETIHPRALVLSAVRKFLDRLEYRSAFLAMRKHRINMNLIYDHNRQMFCENVKTFVQQVEAVNHLNLFLTDLKEEDVTMTMYTVAYNRQSEASGEAEGPTKVDRVCDCVREAVSQIDTDKYLLTILTSYVRRSKPDMEAALSIVKNLRDKPTEGATVTAEDALKYLLFLVDVNQLYDVALGTYDFDLVLMVAEKSQKDPKEYIPFLNNLRRMDNHYRKYTIDRHLRRFHKALQHIANIGEDQFEECLRFTEEHKLYVEALRLFPAASPHYKQVATSYGSYLVEKNRQDEAGVMFVKAEEWELALEAFTACSNWRQIFCMTARLGYTPDREADIARRCARQLQSNKKYMEASVVFEQYAKEVEEAIVCLVEGAQWEEAMRMMYRHKRTDFLETHLKPGIQECEEQHRETLEEYRETFEKHRHRLRVVREQKERQRLEFLDGDVPTNNLDSDLFSDTSSATGASVQSSHYDSQRSTVISRTSGKSSRNRRKGEHRKWSLKEGSQFEDCAIIESLSKLIVNVDSMKEEINSLMKTLVQFNYDTQAASLQKQYDSFLILIDQSIPEVWSDSQTDTASGVPTLGPSMTANAIAQAVQQGQSLETKEKKDPVLVNPPKMRKDIRWRLHMVQSGPD